MRATQLLRLLGLLSAAGLPAQADPDKTVVAAATEKLNDYAKECFAAGYVDRAEEIWREVLAEYDTDDATARKHLGFKRVGTSWAPDPEFRYPEHGEATLAQAKALRKKFERLAEELVKVHLRAAEALAAAGNTERANYHYDRVLRFQPGEPKAAAARSVATFDGLFGTGTEIELLKRSRILRGALAKVKALEIAVAATEAVPAPIAKSGLQVVGFAGPNIACYGDVDPAVVQEAVRSAERSLALCKLVFDGFASYRGDKITKHLFFGKDEASWTKLFEANLDKFPGAEAEFLRERKPAATLRDGDLAVAFMHAPAAAGAYDLAARWTAQSFCSFQTDAMNEGIGHTIVGMLRGENLSFLIGIDEEKGTVASRTRRLKLQTPDMAVWQELAVDTAWEGTSVPAAQLPFLTAASFPTEGRIKAWSFCHFLLLRDPELMRKLDQAPGEQVRTPYELRQKFTALAGIHIDALDAEWRSFWTKDTPLLRSVRGGEVSALEGVSEHAFAWVDAFNDVRKEFKLKVRGLQLPTVHWGETYSEDCKLHVDYLEKNKSERGPGKEDTQELNKAEGTPRGAQFAADAVIVCGTQKPDKAIRDWILWPGYRHALFDPRLDLVGAYATKSVMVMDVTRGIKPAERASAVSYPFDGETEIPTEVTVADLGEEVRKFLDANGAKGAKKVGFPITLHMYGDLRNRLNPEPGFYKCEVLLQGKDPVPGVVHNAEGGSRRAHARGMAVFYPLQPLKRGSSYSVQWTVGREKEGGGHKFTTK